MSEVQHDTLHPLSPLTPPIWWIRYIIYFSYRHIVSHCVILQDSVSDIWLPGGGGEGRWALPDIQ